METLKINLADFRLTDRWDVKVQVAGIVDPRVLVFITTYKSSVDKERREEERRRRRSS